MHAEMQQEAHICSSLKRRTYAALEEAHTLTHTATSPRGPAKPLPRGKMLRNGYGKGRWLRVCRTVSAVSRPRSLLPFRCLRHCRTSVGLAVRSVANRTVSEYNQLRILKQPTPVGVWLGGWCGLVGVCLSWCALHLGHQRSTYTHEYCTNQ